MPDYDENNGNEPDSEFIDKISSLTIGKEIIIDPYKNPEFKEALDAMLLPLGDVGRDCCYCNGSCRYTVPLTGEDRYSLEVWMRSGIIHVKHVGEKPPDVSDHFDRILRGNH
ncbi:MAG: hypothetical protein U9Q92_00140 [archaeon]|nr:hypothetical protein [archaeon]